MAGHADTVPFDKDSWESDPFKLSEREGRLYGLGSADMKAFPLALAAASKFSEIELKQPLILLATADEESSMNGARSVPLRAIQSSSSHNRRTNFASAN